MKCVIFYRKSCRGAKEHEIIIEVKYFSLSKQRKMENKAGRMVYFYIFSKSFKKGVTQVAFVIWFLYLQFIIQETDCAFPPVSYYCSLNVA